LFNVEKVRVTGGKKELTFLQTWFFRDVVINDPSTFDITKDRVLGKLDLPAGMENFSGDTVLFEREQWLLRPGDLVKVELIENRMPSGFYVPIDAINENSGQYSVFVVEDPLSDSKVKKVDVTIADGPNTLKRIEPVEGQTLDKDDKIVLGGVHYLRDDEPVNVAAEVEVN